MTSFCVLISRHNDVLTTLVWERKPNTDKRYAATRTDTNHKLLLLGDSHTRGLAERIGCSLGNSFSVIGITKPNADIKRITSPRHFTPANLTQHDKIILCGGTRDISRNESKSGLCSLKEFAQRTSNTNVILLEAPLRYDLPLSSCVNIGVPRIFSGGGVKQIQLRTGQNGDLGCGRPLVRGSGGAPTLTSPPAASDRQG